MRALLDTNVLIHREGRLAVRGDIGTLFRWLDRLAYSKCVHPGSLDEIRRHDDKELVATLETKLASYEVLRTVAADSEAIRGLRSGDRNSNDALDTSLLAELDQGRVDMLITEDRGIHRKAERVGLAESVFSIDGFLEKVTAENPELTDYCVLSVKKVLFGDIALSDPFFDSLREDYPDFNRWFNRKANETAYVSVGDNDALVAFLYVKREGPGEDYSDINPVLAPATRLKIGLLKVVANGFKLGERFLKIVFDNAIQYRVEEAYVTLFRHRPEQERLMLLLSQWGFAQHGVKQSRAGSEVVFLRSCRPEANRADPRLTYPYMSNSARKFIVPIWPSYHTELLPDSILRTESPVGFAESRPNRNAISKVYLSRSINRDLSPGDIVVFYRTGSGTAPAHHTAVATTLGIVQRVVTAISDEATFVRLCRKRSVFADADLVRWWNLKKYSRPFVVNFLYAHSFPRRPKLGKLKSEGILREAPRGFEELSDEAFHRLLTISNANTRLIVDSSKVRERDLRGSQDV